MTKPRYGRRISVVSAHMLLAACCAVGLTLVPGSVWLCAAATSPDASGNSATSNAGSSNADARTASSAPRNVSSELYGRDLPIVASLGIGPVMDVAVDGNRACFIGGGKLFAADVSQPDQPRVVGTLSGLGNVRQIALRDGIAYVTAREDGLFVVDVHQPAKPKLLCHFDTIEFATGVALSGNLLFVACRNYGVEIIDVSEPADPVHLSIVRTGEAQSVVARNGYLYAGVWGTSQVVAVDVHNPRRPKITASVPLDGFGDGVDVAENHLYVATGHHSRQSHQQQTDPGFGRGHGLEIFDLSDPARPLFVARIKTPKLYHLGMDMWSVTVAGHYAFLADTYNGVFVIDIAAPQHPTFVAHCQLPRDAARGLPSPVGGLAVLEDTVYAAGAWSDLHVLAALGLASRPTQEPDVAPSIPARTPDEPPNDFGELQVYRPAGQVHAVDFVDDLALVACGSAGVHLVRLWPSIRLVRQIKTQGFAVDVRVLGRMVYVAESSHGLSIWRASEDGALDLVGRYRPARRTVRQVVVPPSGRYVLLQVGSHWLHIVDVRDPFAPKLVLSDQRLGLLYRDQIMDGLVDDRFACVFWHVSGLYWYDLGAEPVPAYTGQNYGYRIGSANGLAAFSGRALTICRNGYALLDRHETRPLTELPIYRAGSHRLRGKPTIFGSRLYVAHRPSGEVSIVDIGDPEQPRLRKSFTTPGNPGRIVEQNGSVIIPDGYEGLVITARESK